MRRFSPKQHPTAPLCSLKLWPVLAALMLAFLSAPFCPQEVRGDEQREAAELAVAHRPDTFKKLWKVWPNKKEKEAAIQAWNDLKVTDEELDRMRVAFPRWKFSEDWMKERGKYAPTLATWLNERMWEKEPPPPAPAPPLRVAEASSFLIQPIYLVPRLAFAVSGVIVAGVVWPFDHALGHKVWDTSIGAPWVWHELWEESEESSG